MVMLQHIWVTWTQVGAEHQRLKTVGNRSFDIYNRRWALASIEKYINEDAIDHKLLSEDGNRSATAVDSCKN